MLNDVKVIPALILTLRDSDGSVYEAAVHALVELAEISPSSGLFEALNDEDKNVRIGAAYALAGKGGLAVLPGLFECVRQGGISGDKSEFERMQETIVQIGKPAVPVLVKALKDESVELRFFAAETLGWIGDAEALPHLADALNDEDEDVRYHAVSALQGFGNQGTSVLVNALNHPNEYVRLYAVDALRRIGTPEALAAVEAWRRERGDQQA
jgi:HEAT repeat protein